MDSGTVPLAPPPSGVSLLPEGGGALLSTAEAARHLGVSTSSLRHWRSEGKGPAWCRRGPRLCFYLLADLEKWRRENRPVAGELERLRYLLEAERRCAGPSTPLEAAQAIVGRPGDDG